MHYINSERKYFYNVKKYLDKNKVFFLTWTVSWATNQHITMISDGSWDTEDWRNDAENSALHSKLQYTKIQ